MKARRNFDFSTPAGRLVFYKSALWRGFRATRITEQPWCRECRKGLKVQAAMEAGTMAIEELRAQLRELIPEEKPTLDERWRALSVPGRGLSGVKL